MDTPEIYIIFGPPRVGKTALMAHYLNQAAFDRERLHSMHAEITKMNASGMNLSYPDQPVFANFEMKFKKYLRTPRVSYKINPFRLGKANNAVQTHFIPAYSVVGITEGQKYFDSRMSSRYPRWQSSWMEAHGHFDITIYIDTQRPRLIDVNIRALSKFIEIISLKKITNEYGRIVKMQWKIRRIDNSDLLDIYLASGKLDERCYTEETVEIDYNVFNLYDSKNCKPEFYQGHLHEDFTLNESAPAEETLEGLITYFKQNDNEMPDGFYKKEAA